MARERRGTVVALVACVVVLGVVVAVVGVFVRSMNRTSADVARGFARDESVRLQSLLTAQVPHTVDETGITDAVRQTVRNHGEIRSLTYSDGSVDAVVAVTGDATASTFETQPRASVTVCFHYGRPAGDYDFSVTELDTCP